jgi:hypothetical protein
MEPQLSDKGLLKSLETSQFEKAQISRLRELVPSLGQADRQKLADMIGRSKTLKEKESENNADMVDLNREYRGKLEEAGHRLSKEIRVKGEAVEDKATKDEMNQLEDEMKAM